MKRFFRNAVIIVVLFILLDVLWGFAFQFLRKNAKNGNPMASYYIAEECNEEILIFGSSRAIHHYVPSIFTDMLGYTCYNCGCDGMGCILSCARLNMITDRYDPKLILYDVSSFDYVVDDYTKYLGELKPYYYKDSVKGIIDTFLNPFDRILMNFNMYKNNSRIRVYITSMFGKPDNLNGFRPLQGKMTHNLSRDDEKETELVDEKKLALIIDMINKCKEHDITLVFLVSPVFDGILSEGYQTIKDIAAEYDIPYLDYSTFEETAFHYELFQDLTHMNKDGAAVFSEQVARDLVNYGIISRKETAL